MKILLMIIPSSKEEAIDFNLEATVHNLETIAHHSRCVSNKADRDDEVARRGAIPLTVRNRSRSLTETGV
jgi:hypothetical protein